MNALTAVQNNAVDSGQDYSGFTLIPSAQSPRLLELTLTGTRRPNSFSNRLPNGPCRLWSTNLFCVFG